MTTAVVLERPPVAVQVVPPASPVRLVPPLPEDAPAAPPALDELAARIARCALEAMTGARGLEQLERWLAPTVYAALAGRVRHLHRQRAEQRVPVARITARVRAVRCERLGERADASVVLECGARVRAVSVRLEPIGARWRASALHVL